MPTPQQIPWWQDWNLTYLDDEYGLLYGGHSVHEAFVNTLQKWLPTYIAAINRTLGDEILVVPDDYRLKPEERTLTRDRSAAILVTVPGTTGTPIVRQQGIWCEYKADVQVYYYGTKDWQETEALTQAYAAAVRAAIIQHKGLGGLVETTKWLGEEYVDADRHSTRSTGIARVHFCSTLASVMVMDAGPVDSSIPSVLPPADLPVATTVEATITREPV